MAKRDGYRNEMELAPDVWFRFQVYGRADAVRAQLAQYLGCNASDVVFVENASHGVNAVLRSLLFSPPRDKILYLNLAYQMVKNTLQYVHNVTGEQLLMVNISFPTSPDAIVQAVAEALAANEGQVALASFSHITSVPTLILPIERLASLCHSHGAMVLVDGAHVPGQLRLNIEALDVDFYVGNGHKWLYSPQGSAFLWVHKSRQNLIYPTVISLEGQGQSFFQMAFSWLGTTDFSSYLAMADALDFRASLGDGDIIDYMHSLAVQGGQLLARAWGTELLVPEDMIAAMVNVRLPTDDWTKASTLPQRLLEQYNTWVPAFPLQGHCYVRVSAQIYLELSDFQFLADAVLKLLQE